MSSGRRRRRSGSVGNDDDRPPAPTAPRGIIRADRRMQQQRSASSSSDLGDGNGGGRGTPTETPRGGGSILRPQHVHVQEVPTLSALARDALLYGLADGHAVALSSVAQQVPSVGGVKLEMPVPAPISATEGGVEMDAPSAHMPQFPASTALLHDESFWDGLMAEAARRRILSDAFLTSLCASGLPPMRLDLRGVADLGVTDRFLVKAPPRGGAYDDSAQSGGGTAAQTSQSFASASEMVIASLHHLRLSGNSGGRTGLLGESGAASVAGGGGGPGGGGSINSAVERLVGRSDLETFLHRLSRLASNLQTLHLGPGLLQHETSNAWLGSVKAVSSSCRNLRSLRLHGLSFGGMGRSTSDSSAGGAGGGGGGSSVNALFEALARNCTSLEELSLARCSGFHDRHGQALLLELRDGSMSVPNLLDLDLSYTDVGGLTFSALCSRHVDGGFATGGIGGIRRLNLDGTALDISWLQRILDSMAPHLEEVSILSCPHLSSGPDLWSVFEKAASKPEEDGLVNLSSLSVELCFKSYDILPLEETNDGGVGMHDELVAMAVAQYADKHADDGLSFDMEFDVGWSCRHCTLINEGQAHRCAACNGRRFPHPSSDDAAANDWPDSDTDEEITDSKKPAPVFEFLSLEKCPLKKFTALLHVDDRDDGNDTNDSSQVATVLVSKILHALPEGLSELKLSLPDERRLFLDQENNVVSCLVKRHGQSLRSLELKYVLIRDIASLHELCGGLQELRRLKFFGIGDLGLSTSSILRAISSFSGDKSALPKSSIEILQLCILNASVTEATPDTLADDEMDVTFNSPFLKRLWLQGCVDLEKLELVTPTMERLSVIECSALAHLGFHDSMSGSSNPLEHLRLSGNVALSPYSIASLKLPNLVRLDVDGMVLVEDWEFGSLVNSASQSLTTLRLKQCRSLGDVNQWLHRTSFQPLSVLELRRPSPSFDLNTLQNLFNSHMRKSSKGKRQECFGSMRDLAVESAPGLKGFICAPLLHTNPVHLGHANREATEEGDRLATLLSKSASISRIGIGAIDEESSIASTEMLGGRGIERILANFLESARGGGSSEYGFPPTLNSYQRKLVHDAAEEMNLEHESIRLNTGVKVVRVRRRTNETDMFDGVNAAERENNVHEINVESQTTPSNLEVAFLAGAREQSTGVTFGPVEVEQEVEQNGDDAGDEDVEGIFELDDDAHNTSGRRGRTTSPLDDRPDSDADSDMDAGSNNEEGQTLEEVPRMCRARSRRERRKAKKAARKGQPQNQNGQHDANDESSEEGNDEEVEHDEIAFYPLLQCERFARFDPKMLRRLVALAHKLPVDQLTGNAVCIRYLRGSCPYQKARNGGSCRYAHFDVKASQAKKFSPLIDYVCGREDTNTGGRGRKSGSRRKSHDREVACSYGSSNAGSLGSDSGAQMMEAHVGGRRGRGRRRKGSIGNEEDDYEDRTNRSYGTDETSDDGMSSRGSISDGPTSALSSSPGAFDASQTFSVTNAPPLNLQRLLCLELVDCEGISGASLDGSCLVRLCLQGCSLLSTLDLRTPKLTTIDVSECRSLRSIPLHDESLRGLRVANLTGCRSLDEAFMSRLVNHCRALRQLHIFGSGASEKASNARVRQKVKTKAGLAKLTAGRPKLTLITTKKEWRVLQAKREGMASGSYEGDDAARLL